MHLSLRGVCQKMTSFCAMWPSATLKQKLLGWFGISLAIYCTALCSNISAATPANIPSDNRNNPMTECRKNLRIYFKSFKLFSDKRDRKHKQLPQLCCNLLHKLKWEIHKFTSINFYCYHLFRSSWPSSLACLILCLKSSVIFWIHSN